MKHCVETRLPKYRITLLLSFLFIGGLTAQNKSASEINYQKINQPQSPEDLSEGLRYFDSLASAHLLQKDTLATIYDLRLAGIATYKLGDYYASEKQMAQALSLVDAHSTSETLLEPRSGLYNSLGMVYNELLDYPSARKAYQKSLEYAQNRRDSLIMLNNIGNTYLDTRQFEDAGTYYQQALDLVAPGEYDLNRVTALDNLGRVYSNLNNPKALELLQQGLSLRKSLGHNGGIYASYKSLAQHQFRQGRKEPSISYADSALQMAKKLNSPSYIKDALSLQIDLGQFQYAEAYKKLNDSLATAKQQADNKYAALKYNVEQERRSTEAQKIAKEEEKKLRLFYQWLILFLVLCALFVFYFFRNRQRFKLQQQVQLTESHISKKVHDEVANEVYGVMTRLQGKESVSEDVIDHLEHIYNKTRNISREHNPIDPNEPFEEVLQDLILPFQNSERNVITKNTAGIDWDKIPLIKKTALYRILQELLTNTKKHSQATIVAITFHQHGKKISLDYADNGLGTSLKKRGGLLNTENRIQSLGGKITFESSPNKGFKSKIEL